MCGRFNIIDDPFTKLLVEITGQHYSVETRFNIAPTEQVPVLVIRDETDWDLLDMRWWLIPNWAKEVSTKYSLFNAKSETLAKSSAFREPFKKRRCIVPVSGYYEWKKEGIIKVPYYIEPREEAGFAFAGLWDRWQGSEQIIDSCTIITAAAPGSMKAIHNRIPVHLSKEQVKRWVDPEASPEALMKLMVSEIRFPLSVTPMSTYVNNARNKGEECIEPVGETVKVG